MPSWQDTIILSAMVAREVKGTVVPVNSSAPNWVGIYPTCWTTGPVLGPRATAMIVHPMGDCLMAIDAAASTVGPDSARLFAGVNYVFPIHPQINTLSFLDLGAATSSQPVHIVWVHGR